MTTTTATNVTTQIYRVYIKATPQAIWDAITKPEWTERYGYGGRGEFDLRPGGAYRGMTSQAMRSMGAPEVGVDHPSDRGDVEEAAPAQAIRRQHVAQEAGEGTAEPVAEWHAEALLAAAQDLGRQAVGERPLEQALQAAEAPQLQRRRDAAHELDEGVIEERRSQLEPGRHAGAVAVQKVPG